MIQLRLARTAFAAAWTICAALGLASLAIEAHPHDEPEIFTLKGTLTKADVVNRAIELDTIDPDSRMRRNMLFFVDRKAKVLNGQARIDLQALQVGQRIICIIERQFLEGRQDRERVMVFEISLDPVC